MTKKKKHREDQTLQTVCYCKLCSIDEFTGNFDENDDRYMMHDDMVYTFSSHFFLARNKLCSGVIWNLSA